MENKINFPKLKKYTLFNILEYIPKDFLILNFQKIKSKRFFKYCMEIRRNSYLPNTQISKFVNKNYEAEHFIYSSCFSSSGNYFATGSRGNSATIYAVNPLYQDTYEKEIFKFYCLSEEDINNMYKDITKEMNEDTKEVNHFDHREDGEEYPEKIINSINAVCFSYCEKYFATGSSNNMVTIYGICQYNKETYGKDIVKISDHKGGISYIDFQKVIYNDGRIYFATASKDINVIIYCFEPLLKKATATKLLTINILTIGTVKSISFSCNNYIAIGGKDSKTYVYKLFLTNDPNLCKQSLDLTLSKQNKAITSVSYSNSGDLLATGSFDYSVTVYSMNTAYVDSYGKVLFKYNDHSGWISSLCFSNSEDYLITAAWDGKAIIYCLNPVNKDYYGKKLCNIDNLDTPILSVSYSEQGILSLGLLDEICLFYC